MPVPQLLASVFLGWGAWRRGVRPSPWQGVQGAPLPSSARASPVKEGGQEAPQQDLVPRARADVTVHELRPCDVYVGACSGEQEGGRGTPNCHVPYLAGPRLGLGPGQATP